MSIRAWLRVAALGAATTAGALVGFGARRGAPVMLLSAAGDRLRGVPAFVAPDRTLGASAWFAVAHHVLVSVAWGLAFAIVAGRLRGARLAAVALLVALVAVNADAVLPPWCAIAAGVASLPQRAVLVAVLAIALGQGTALAHIGVRTERHR